MFLENWPNVHHQANHSKSLEHHKQNLKPKYLVDLYTEVAKCGFLRVL